MTEVSIEESRHAVSTNAHHKDLRLTCKRESEDKMRMLGFCIYCSTYLYQDQSICGVLEFRTNRMAPLNNFSKLIPHLLAR